MHPVYRRPLIITLPRHLNPLRLHTLTLRRQPMPSPDLMNPLTTLCPNTVTTLRQPNLVLTPLRQCASNLPAQIVLDPGRNGCRRVLQIKLPVLKLLADPALELILKARRL